MKFIIYPTIRKNKRQFQLFSRLLRDEECNILQNLSRDEFREFRTLVIDMVLATDMSFHFQQLKNMKSLLTLAEPTVDKSKAASLVLHCSDISHPAKVRRQILLIIWLLHVMSLGIKANGHDWLRTGVVAHGEMFVDQRTEIKMIMDYYQISRLTTAF